ncbi:hypothetical protein BDN67DRAFT_635950 [Paxillus ammoniavirescens]|nr:hypothetical protein BDN67DRAFT_635950 [Paxillus ammoniavirescens]
MKTPHGKRAALELHSDELECTPLEHAPPLLSRLRSRDHGVTEVGPYLPSCPALRHHNAVRESSQRVWSWALRVASHVLSSCTDLLRLTSPSDRRRNWNASVQKMVSPLTKACIDNVGNQRASTRVDSSLHFGDVVHVDDSTRLPSCANL